MTRQCWRELPPVVRAICLHEAAHGVLGELLGWRVHHLRLHARGGGVCVFKHDAPSPLVDAVASVAGNSAERYYFGRLLTGGNRGSSTDRREASAAMQVAGVDGLNGALGVMQTEQQLWPVYTDPGVSGAVRRVARALGQKRHLGRAEFLKAAVLQCVNRRAVRRYCRRLALQVHAQHL